MAFDFPNSPGVGQTFQGYIWDGEKWTSNATLSPPPVPPPLATSQRGYIAGLNLSIATQPTMTVAPGIAADSTNTTMMYLAAALAKTTAAWAPGNNAGGLDTGVMTAQAWYHWYLIYNPTTLAVDVIFSATATPDAGPTVMPSGYTKYRRIGSVRFTASALWFVFSQNGDEFLYAIGNNDVTNANLSVASRQLFALLTPPGIVVNALMRLTVTTAANIIVILTSPSESDQAPAGAGAGVTARTSNASDAGSTHVVARTDNQGRIGVRSSAAGNFFITTYGYIDRRGKDN